MEIISLSQTLPNVFASRANMTSDVWSRDLCFERGHTYLIEAQSGTGKSSLCSFITGHRDDYQGSFRFDGRDIRELRVTDWVELRQRHLSHLFQELRLFPELTAWENVQVKNNLTHWKEDKELHAWFGALGIADKEDAKVGRMSFGQQQRVAMIRALAQPFDFLLADEPVSHLDDENSCIMAELMMHEAKAQGAGVIVTSIGKRMDLPYDEILNL